MAVFFFIIGAVSLLLAVHPFSSYPVSLMIVRALRGKRPVAPAPDGGSPRVAVCCAAYNEASVIEAKARNLIESAEEYPGTELWVYVDGATDDTAARLASFGDRISVVAAGERRGKSHGMNTLVQRTDADILVFTDANVMFDAGVISGLVRYFQDPRVGCVCGHLRYGDTGASGTALAGGLYWRLEEYIKQLESDSGSAMGADGSLFAIRRSLHNAVPEDVIDDMYVSLDILCQGSRVVRAPDVVAHEPSIPSVADEFRRKVRISCQALNVHRLMWPRLRKLGLWNLYKYLSHKLLRWFGGYLLLSAWLFLTLAFVAVGWEMPAFMLTAAPLAVLGAGLVRPNRLSGVALGVLSAFLASAMGIVESVRGKRYQVWSPADSIRLAKEEAQ